MTHNGDFVTYGRWEEAHRALVDRVVALEQGSKARKDRLWQLALGVGGGIAISILSTSIIAILHIRGGG